VGTVDTTIPPLLLSNHTTVDNVKASYFVYMTNATRRYEPIAVQTAAKQLAQKNCSDSLASIQKEFQRALSPLGLVAVVVPGNDLQVIFINYGIINKSTFVTTNLIE
jgi:hypothetical protein